jgi:hypothetical protein
LERGSPFQIRQWPRSWHSRDSISLVIDTEHGAINTDLFKV